MAHKNSTSNPKYRISRMAAEMLEELITEWMQSSDLETGIRIYAPRLAASPNAGPLSEVDICKGLVRELGVTYRNLPDLVRWYTSPEQIELRVATQTRIRKRLEGIAARREAEKLREAEDRDRRRILAEAKAKRLEELRAREEAARAQERARLEAKAISRRRLQSALDRDFLSADEHYRSDPEAHLIDPEEWRAIKTQFVSSWFRARGFRLDDEQAYAVSLTGGDVKITARAGSGKTRVLIARAFFLIAHCGVDPSEIMLLAFNREAAEQMKERLAELLSGRLPHVMTFHALARAVVHPDEEILTDSGESQRLSSEIQEVVDEHIRSPRLGQDIRELMLSHFREDWYRIEDGGFHLSKAEFLDHRRLLPRTSLNGDPVKSFGEKLIANTLFENDIAYQYERSHRWGGEVYRPDFTIPLDDRREVIIEYWGLAGDEEYDKRMGAKRKFWASQKKAELVEIVPSDITARGEHQFREYLLDILGQRNIAFRPLSEDEIWERIRRRALDTFTRTVRTFVGRARVLNIAPSEILERLAFHSPATSAEEKFIPLAASIAAGYAERVDRKRQDDFAGITWRAIRQLQNRDTRFSRDGGRESGDVGKLKHVLIDEFQDYSKMFSELVAGIRVNARSCQIFCVGDDWQAINGFAGSDLNFFRNFEKYSNTPRTAMLTRNYRSPKKMVALSNALMVGHGTPAVAATDSAGEIYVCDLQGFSPSAHEIQHHQRDEITPAILRILRHFLNQDRRVTILSRKSATIPYQVAWRRPDSLKDIEGFQEHLRSYLPRSTRKNVVVRSTHGYKGREEDAIIILDALDRSYPLIHPNWVFTRIFGDSMETILEEERRLFYVALTRAMRTLVIVTDSKRPSSFLRETQDRISVPILPWDTLPASVEEADYVEVLVRQTWEVWEELKALGYRFDSRRKCFVRSVKADDFNIDSLLAEPWIDEKVRIEVRSHQGEVLHQHQPPSRTDHSRPQSESRRK